MTKALRGGMWSAAILLTLAIATPTYPIGIRIDVSSGGILEDAILIASQAGDPVRDVVILGDLDLSRTEHVYDVAVDPATTHWWLIGHEGSNVVYSSVLDLLGVDMYAVEPYDIPGAEFAWNIPANLDGYVNGTGFSFDWWAQTVNNHHSHVAADGASARLWLFASPGSGIGTIGVNLHSNDIPGTGDGGEEWVIPEPCTIALLGLGLLGAGTVRRRSRRL